MKYKGTAALITFFLGGIGIHRFYLGQVGAGFFYLLFCWTLIPSLIAFIDFFAFLFMSRAAFDRKYNSHLLHPAATIEATAKASKPMDAGDAAIAPFALLFFALILFAIYDNL